MAKVLEVNNSYKVLLLQEQVVDEGEQHPHIDGCFTGFLVFRFMSLISVNLTLLSFYL